MELTLSDGNTMSYSDAGNGDYLFICIHGGGGDRSHLLPQYDYLSQIGRAINVDLRGYGKSSKLNKFGVIEQYAEDIKELIDSLSNNKTHIILVGHSMGGMVAVEFTARYPKLIQGLIMISSGIIFPEDAKKDEEQFLKDLAGSDFNNVLNKLVDQLLPFKQDTKCYELVKKTFFNVTQKQWVSHFKSMMAWDKVAKERLSYCKCPMLYIEDGGGCYSDLNLVKTICPQLFFGKVVCSGHFPTIEVPDQVNAMIGQFFNISVLKSAF